MNALTTWLRAAPLLAFACGAIGCASASPDSGPGFCEEPAPAGIRSVVSNGTQVNGVYTNGVDLNGVELARAST